LKFIDIPIPTLLAEHFIIGVKKTEFSPCNLALQFTDNAGVTLPVEAGLKDKALCLHGKNLRL
tara:strand:+ start:316 stop:504 length:189 start_codon:yes stop_codon:yes gene_type:complete